MLSGSVCPPWVDAAEHELPAHEASVRAVWLQACIESKYKRPGRKDLRRWHVRAFRDVVPLDYYAGHFRQLDPQRPCLGKDVGVRQPDGSVVAGTPHQEVLKLMGEFESDLHAELASAEREWSSFTGEQKLQNAALVVGLAVATLVKIHPFVNGNGRTSRILWGVLLARLGLPVAMAVVKRPGDPYGAVMDQAMRGNPAPAVALVLAGIAHMTPPDELDVSANA